MSTWRTNLPRNIGSNRYRNEDQSVAGGAVTFDPADPVFHGTGTATSNSGAGSTTIGPGAVTTGGTSASAFGLNATASAANALALGHNTVASQPQSSAVGNSALSSGAGASAYGNSASVAGTNAFVIGPGATASGIAAAGSATIVAGAFSVASGDNNIILGGLSATSGSGTAVYGNGLINTKANSSIFGNNSTITLRLNDPAVGNYVFYTVPTSFGLTAQTPTIAQFVGGMIFCSFLGTTTINISNCTGAALDAFAWPGGLNTGATGMTFQCFIVPTAATVGAIQFTGSAAGLTFLNTTIGSLTPVILTFTRTGLAAWIAWTK